MKQEWKVKGEIVEYPDGQRRWDMTYLCLLRWAYEPEIGSLQWKQEVPHESSSLRTGFDQQTGRYPDD